MKKESIFSIIFLLIIFFLVHLVGIKFYFYWTFWWFDIPMHFFGGFLICFLPAVYLRSVFKNKILYLTSVVFFSFAVGIFWEVFELKTGMTRLVAEGYWNSTLSDLVLDVAGGLFASLVALKSPQS